MLGQRVRSTVTEANEQTLSEAEVFSDAGSDDRTELLRIAREDDFGARGEEGLDRDGGLQRKLNRLTRPLTER